MNQPATHKTKILVICTLVNTVVSKYKDCIEYLPLSNADSDRSFEQLLNKYKPTSIVFGLQTINEEKLSLWRTLQPNDNLKFVRKGTSLHRVDFAAAKKFNIEVLNTPGINAPFVAKFITDILLTPEKNNCDLSILGVGEIGKLVARKAIEDRQHVVLYNRTHYHFTGEYTYNDDLLSVFKNSQQIAICLPLNDSTKSIITEEHIYALPNNAEIVCISPPRVMSADAIVALDKRKDIKIIFDHVASGMQLIEESLGHKQLRHNFIFEEKAAASDECQSAMGEAAIIAASV